jgi:hypothetical protein
MFFWEACWFAVGRFLSAPLLALRLMRTYHEAREAVEKDVQLVHNSRWILGQYISVLQDMERQITESDLYFPSARKAMMEITLMLMDELVKKQKEKLDGNSQNGHSSRKPEPQTSNQNGR